MSFDEGSGLEEVDVVRLAQVEPFLPAYRRSPSGHSRKLTLARGFIQPHRYRGK